MANGVEMGRMERKWLWLWFRMELEIDVMGKRESSERRKCNERTRNRERKMAGLSHSVL